jgi:hypothetical protein
MATTAQEVMHFMRLMGHDLLNIVLGGGGDDDDDMGQGPPRQDDGEDPMTEVCNSEQIYAYDGASYLLSSRTAWSRHSSTSSEATCRHYF